MNEIRTERLLLRQWRPQIDLDAMARINANPQVTRFLDGADGSTYSRKETEEGIAERVNHWEEHGFGLFAVELSETGALIGEVGLAIPTFLPEVLPAVEVGWRFDRSFWGRGLATEGARACLALGFDELGLERVVAIIHPANVESRRVAEKLGLRVERETVHPKYGHGLVIHAIDRDRWLLAT